MARDIEEFLRRAAERRRQQQQKKQGGGEQARRVREVIEQQDVEIVQPVEIVYAEEVKPEPRRTLIQKTQDLRTQSVAEHVRSHIDTQDIASHADHLGDDIQRVDDQVAARLKRKFSHDVGQLDDLPSVQDDKVATVTQERVSDVVAGLVQMMRSPKSVRQAILISEILKRPNFDD